MKTIEELGQVGAIAVDRRSFLRMIGAGAAVVCVPSVLSACGSATPTKTATSETTVGDVIPSYIPVDYVKPDFPSINGSVPGFLTLPKNLVQSVKKIPKNDTTYKAMTPL